MSLSSFIREPIVHFLILGVGIFILNSVFNPTQDSPDSTQIVVDDDDIERLITQYKQVWNDKPNSPTIKKLIDQYVHSEVMYREALALKLDHNDEIIKRRLKQKYEFLIKDMITTSQITDEELNAYYEDHKSGFSTDKLYSFYQFYFSPDKRNNSMQDAMDFLGEYNANPKSSIPSMKPVDPSHLSLFYKQVTRHQIRQEFGLSFADALQDVNSESWYGPIASGYGVHVVYIDQITVSKIEDFNQVKDQVLEAYEKDLIQQYNQNIYDSTLENYTIDIKLDKWAHVLE